MVDTREEGSRGGDRSVLVWALVSVLLMGWVVVTGFSGRKACGARRNAVKHGSTGNDSPAEPVISAIALGPNMSARSDAAASAQFRGQLRSDAGPNVSDDKQQGDEGGNVTEFKH